MHTEQANLTSALGIWDHELTAGMLELCKHIKR